MEALFSNSTLLLAAGGATLNPPCSLLPAHVWQCHSPQPPGTQPPCKSRPPADTCAQPRLTEAEGSSAGLGQICKSKSPSFVSSNGMSRSSHSLKGVTQCHFLRLGGTGASDPGGPIPSHALLFFPRCLLAATHLNRGHKLILTARGRGVGSWEP